uniref:Uncharacterized protein n=1 Tax=Timema monikensis TaxID=170555 RepID=A0A7R9EGR5_9NEOP|nr:unnamed protein product [Timema monikensis]
MPLLIHPNRIPTPVSPSSRVQSVMGVTP